MAFWTDRASKLTLLFPTAGGNDGTLAVGWGSGASESECFVGRRVERSSSDLLRFFVDDFPYLVDVSDDTSY